MTGPGGPQRPTPEHHPPRSPQGSTGGARRPGRDRTGDDPPVLAPHEEARIEDAVTLVGRRGRGPGVVAAVVVAAFLLGLLRPWDLLESGTADGAPPGGPAGTLAAGVGDPGDPDEAHGGDTSGVPRSPGSPAPSSDGVAPPRASGSPERTAPTAPRRALTCAYPSQWRTATIEDWTGRQARVWKAAEVVPATGPEDPSIPFEPIVAATVTAIGWCAPVVGDDRPPLTLAATLYRLRDGVATVVPYDRLEPGAPDAFGELWVPLARGVGNRPSWPMGRYVIELRSPSGSYVRYLGLELADRLLQPGAGSPPP